MIRATSSKGPANTSCRTNDSRSAGVSDSSTTSRAMPIESASTAAGAGWFGGALLAFTVFMYAVSEILANRIPTQEEYVGLTPVVAILPWFLAGSLFPITALPAWLAWAARALPTPHALALLRYGMLDH